MHTSVKDSTQPSKRATKPAASQPTSIDKQQDANHPSRVAWRQALGERMQSRRTTPLSSHALPM